MGVAACFYCIQLKDGYVRQETAPQTVRCCHSGDHCQVSQVARLAGLDSRWTISSGRKSICSTQQLELIWSRGLN
ncbi:hypothetical protein DL98DRAFT_62597 [Cadophora sp. DSE1049]|nr:hypothetical protein DL98DRAFT_62597 [Cadophora sp. DSE1049]